MDYKELIVNYISVSLISFIFTVILSWKIIPILRAHKIGQSIRAEGPSWHKGKAGTPTMGGICFIMAMLVALAVMTVVYALIKKQNELIPLALTLVLALTNGLVGFVDDYNKLIKKQNEGLKWYQKLSLQIIVAVIYVVLLKVLGHIDTSLAIPFTDISFELGIFYYIFAVVLIVGMVNSVNLTDGIDGLAGTVTLVVAIFFAVVAFSMMNPSLLLISGALVGGIAGFLIFNIHPAKVFMGDTGSLFLGGCVTGAAFLINQPLIIVIVGGIYVIEALSDIIQVVSFKTRNKRVFKMAPIHHHFEKCGWSEGKIVTVFSVITALLSIAGWFAL
ncbi:MAG: phospho-N-acetylmuramoyl-pentapeptide-transferase [Ruminococcaceae bacterium]|nr:phospho-N-acetylmuramoyl-pentapeptide-transferase [Oscillospiraceae bacterium]